MAVSGTVILLVLRLQKSPSPVLSRVSPQPSSMISSVNMKHEKGKKRKKRVHFAEDVVDPTGNSEDYRKLRSNSSKNNITWEADNINNKYAKSKAPLLKKGGGEMPANRVALYNGILRDRVHKMRTSY
ncbi:hypothetical protein F511_28782 [Dorcoceras hygrometricum]|uniref:Uncharacterized protein n=1 Tax=Dorcoceras hygrometricum TaxID=472368 RepID=A0A2Z7CXS5_9LAMI|nr:hypothetical protein F511_28782 [Dorcoceras hygrometricum]